MLHNQGLTAVPSTLTISLALLALAVEAVAHLPIFGSGSIMEVYQIRREGLEHLSLRLKQKTICRMGGTIESKYQGAESKEQGAKLKEQDIE